MEFSKKLFLNPSKQLFDIHGNITKFKTYVSISSDNDEPYFYAFTNQSELDSDKDISYKISKKNITDEFMYTGNDYQNHFISLKSDKPLTVHVNLKTISLETDNDEDSKGDEKEQSFTSTTAFKVFVFFSVLFVSYFVYTKFIKKSVDEKPIFQLPSSNEKFKQPKINMFDMKSIEVPKVEIPIIEVPKVEIPTVEVPKIEVPKIELPTVEVPKIEVPKIEKFDFDSSYLSFKERINKRIQPKI
jgi:hypothetical protein